MRHNFSRFLVITGLLSSCMSGETKTAFTQVLLPYYSDIGKLAVLLEGEFEPDTKQEIIDSLRECSLFSDLKIIEKPLNVGNDAAPEAFEQHLNKFAKSSSGLLRIRMEHKEISDDSVKSQSFLFFDQPDYDWYPSFGVPRMGTMGFANTMEIGPEVKKRRRSPLVKTTRYQQVYRMTLFNKATSKVALDRVGKSISEFSTFSKEPALKKPQFEALVRSAMLQDINFFSCPPSQPVERHLYSMGTDSPAAQTIDEGVDEADSDQWMQAAVLWNKVVASDPKNAIAHHNLGVFHERQGNVIEALKHYRLGFRDKRILEDPFGDIIGRFLPQNDVMEPTVAQVTGGNWVFVDVPEGEKRTRASVYRASPIIDPDSSRIVGQDLKEIATLRFVTSQESRRAARVREYLLDSPVRAGDIVVFGEGAASKTP